MNENTIYQPTFVASSLEIGRGNIIHEFCCLGKKAQITNNHEMGGCQVGDNNVFREYVSVHSGVDSGRTIVGNENLLMAYSHVGHDSQVGNKCVLGHQASVGGHCNVGNGVNLGAGCFIQQFTLIGAHSFVTPGTLVDAQVPPFTIAHGFRAKVKNINVIGMRRAGIADEHIRKFVSYFRKTDLNFSKENVQAFGWKGACECDYIHSVLSLFVQLDEELRQ